MGHSFRIKRSSRSCRVAVLLWRITLTVYRLLVVFRIHHHRVSRKGRSKATRLIWLAAALLAAASAYSSIVFRPTP